MERDRTLLVAARDAHLVLDGCGAGTHRARLAPLGAGLACALGRNLSRGSLPDSVPLGERGSVYAQSGSPVYFGIPYWVLSLADIVSALEGNGLRVDRSPQRLRLFGRP
jgi:hypothetical protein